MHEIPDCTVHAIISAIVNEDVTSLRANEGIVCPLTLLHRRSWDDHRGILKWRRRRRAKLDNSVCCGGLPAGLTEDGL